MFEILREVENADSKILSPGMIGQHDRFYSTVMRLSNTSWLTVSQPVYTADS